MDIGACLEVAERLLERPYPSRPTSCGFDLFGPGYHVVSVAVSGQFWDDPGDLLPAVWEQYEGMLSELVAALTRAWGLPRLLPVADDLGCSCSQGQPNPPLIEAIAGFVSEAYVWSRHGRAVLVGLGQWDRELPVQLVLATGELDLNDWALPTPAPYGR